MAKPQRTHVQSTSMNIPRKTLTVALLAALLPTAALAQEAETTGTAKKE